MAKWGNTPDKMLAKGKPRESLRDAVKRIFNEAMPDNLEPTPELLEALSEWGVYRVTPYARRKVLTPAYPIISK